MIASSRSRPLGGSRAAWLEAERIAELLRGRQNTWWIEWFDPQGRLVDRRVVEQGFILQAPRTGYCEYGWLLPPPSAYSVRDQVWRLPNGIVVGTA